MRLLFRLTLWLSLLIPLALSTAAWFALENTPRVGAQRHLSHDDIARARDIINVTIRASSRRVAGRRCR